MPKLSRVKLTKRTVEATSAPATSSERDGVFVWDSEVRGFALRVYGSGKKVFLYQYRSPTDGRTRRLALGAFPGTTAEDARARAILAAGTVEGGADPKGTNEEKEAQQRTLAKVFPEYLAENRAKIAPRTFGDWQRIWVKQLAPAFGAELVALLDRNSIARWHASRASTPIAANRAVETLRTFFNWAESRGFRADGTNPCKRIKLFDEERKSRSLTADEYARLGSALRMAAFVGLAPSPKVQGMAGGLTHEDRTKLTGKTRGPYKTRAPFLLPAGGYLKGGVTPSLMPANPSAVAALRFLVLSGWRENEALTLRWDAVNMERGVAVLADTKAGRSERPLGNAALDVLRAQTRVEGNPYVFTGEREGRHVGDLKRVWLAVKHAARLEETAPLRLHDLRHSFTTVARDEMGLGDHVIARLVGHTLSGMTSRYGEVRDATVRNAANGIAEAIANYLNPTEAKVLAFPGHARRA